MLARCVALAAVLAGGLRAGAPPQVVTLIQEGRTQEARAEIQRLLQSRPGDAELYYQLARTHLHDFYAAGGPRGAPSLDQAIEALRRALELDPNHVAALKSKASLHARPELLRYDPNLAWELASRAARLEPRAHEYLLALADWLGGEVRFLGQREDRVPQDPLLGLDRAIGLLGDLLAAAIPFEADEQRALLLMGRTLAKRGSYAASLGYFRTLLNRPLSAEQRAEVLRELGTSFYRMGSYAEAARMFRAAVQTRPTLLDLWLLQLAAEQSGGADRASVFPLREERFDPSDPPRLRFTDIAPELGINRRDGNGTCAWGDYDGDGDLDLFTAGSGHFVALFRNEGGKFRDATEQAGLARVPSGYSLNLVDYDNDGRLDLYVSLNGWSGPYPNRLLRNLGDGRFQDVSRQAGLADPGSGFVSLWGDLDHDGWLDLVVANGVLKDGSVPQIYRNNGDGTFANVTRRAGLEEPPDWGAIGIALGDYDRDGDLDLFVNGLGNGPNRLYRNNGDFTFTNVTDRAGVAQAPHNGFVAFFFDYNNDGWPDLLTTSLAPWDAVLQGLTRQFSVPSAAGVHPDATRLFRNNRDGTFTDVTFSARLYYPAGTMGAGVADLDNDGFLDIYLGTGDPSLSRLEPNRLFRNNGDGTFTDLTFFAGVARPGKKGHGVCFVDFDEDGDLDLYAQQGGHYPGDAAENVFYRNERGSENHWLGVELVPARGNRFAVGAQLLLQAGNWTLHREVKGSEGFGSTSPYRVHFGLGPHRRAERLEVRWPGGSSQEFRDIEANQIIQIRQDSASWRRLR
ncbi:MAG: FG-GAP-like repeat-containing protein [Bryobacterales bacterium]|nr:FG-GAP-like repeat-containing protein [Bryobacterales bacterium]